MKPLFLKDGQKLFVEPRDISPENTFANTRTTEFLNEFKILEQEMVRLRTGRKGRTQDHMVYDISSFSPQILGRILEVQHQNHVPITLWTRFGNGPAKRWRRDRPDLKKLKNLGLVVTANTLLNKK